MMSSFKYIFPYLKGKDVLDIGCNKGEYLCHFSKNSIGLDISMPCLYLCKKKSLHMICLDLNSPHLPFKDQSFDAVFFSHTLEHLCNPIQSLQEVLRVLTKGGVLIVGLPIEKCLVRFLSKDDYYKSHSHLFAFSPANLKKILEYVGFNIQSEIYFDLPLCRSFILSKFLNIYQLLPCALKECISPAFWMIAVKS